VGSIYIDLRVFCVCHRTQFHDQFQKFETEEQKLRTELEMLSFHVMIAWGIFNLAALPLSEGLLGIL
jgi:hypothetical protein